MNKTLQQCIDFEEVLKNEPAMCVKNGELQLTNGRLVLTSRRLIYGSSLSAPPCVAIDLDTINTIGRESYITDHNILSVTYLLYENVKFSVLSYEGWQDAIEVQRMSPHVEVSE